MLSTGIVHEKTNNSRMYVYERPYQEVLFLEVRNSIFFSELVEHFIFMACPSLCSGRAIRCKPSRGHARIYTYTHTERSVFYLIFYSGAGGWVNPKTPQKNTSFALGMRRACVSMVRTAPKR